MNPLIAFLKFERGGGRRERMEVTQVRFLPIERRVGERVNVLPEIPNTTGINFVSLILVLIGWHTRFCQELSCDICFLGYRLPFRLSLSNSSLLLGSHKS